MLVEVISHFDTMKGEAGLKCDKTGYVDLFILLKLRAS